MKTRSQTYMEKHLGKLVGKKVVGLARDDGDDCGEECWGIRFADGAIAWIMRDPEGNGPGHLDIQAAEVSNEV